MKNIVPVALISLLLMTFVQMAFALESTIGIRGGGSYPVMDVNESPDWHLMGGVSYEAWLKDNFSLGIYPYFTTLSSEDGLLSFDANVVGADILAKYRPTKTVVVNFDKGCLRRITPFVDLGLGVNHYDTKLPVSGGDKQQELTIPKHYKSRFAFVLPSAGAGVSFITKWNLNVDLGVQLDYAWDDQIDRDLQSKMNDAYLMPYLGVGYTFGKKDKDSSQYPHHKILNDKISMKKDFVLHGVQFEFDSAVLTQDAKIILDKVIFEMKKHPKVKVDIQGHTDNVGTVEYNNQLSLKRAESVKTYMVENGVETGRITTQGFGPSRPIATNDTDAGRAENRRIEFVIVK